MSSKSKKTAVFGWERLSIGRDDRIRTYDPHTPSVMRYQAALRPDRWSGIADRARAYMAAGRYWQAFWASVLANICGSLIYRAVAPIYERRLVRAWSVCFRIANRLLSNRVRDSGAQRLCPVFWTIILGGDIGLMTIAVNRSGDQSILLGLLGILR